MVAGMAAPAYAGIYYIGDGNITITKDEKGDVYVKHANSTDKTKGDLDKGEITIKGGKRSEDTPAPGGGSSGTGTTGTATSPAQSNLTTLNSEDDSDNEAEDKVYLGDTKGGGEENKNQSGDTTGGEENKNQPNNTTGGEENENQTGGTTGGEENENQSGGTTGGEKNETDFTKKTQTGDSPVLGSQLTYTGPSLNVADANDDEETRDESTTALKTAAENFRNTAENVTNYVIKIINKVKDSTLNVTLEDVNIKANNDAALSVEGAGNTKITLSGSNTLTGGDGHAGLEHNEKSKDDNDDSVDTGKLTITSEKDSGILTATGGSGAAGIGGARNNGAGIIEIAGGTITEAIGGDGGAGIGGGANSSQATTINITGGTIKNATGKDGGAGIGSGANSFGTTTVNITSGTVKAQGGDYGAGIGGGDNSRNTNITISGGTIEEAVGGSTGDGIGGGNSSRNITVTIQGGTIKKAQGGKGNFSPAAPSKTRRAAKATITAATASTATAP